MSLPRMVRSAVVQNRQHMHTFTVWFIRWLPIVWAHPLNHWMKTDIKNNKNPIEGLKWHLQFERIYMHNVYVSSVFIIVHVDGYVLVLEDARPLLMANYQPIVSYGLFVYSFISIASFAWYFFFCIWFWFFYWKCEA